MRKVLCVACGILWASLLGVSAAELGEAVATKPSVALKVRPLKGESSKDTNWQSAWGSSDKSFTDSVAIGIDVRNMRQEPVDVIVEWIFFAKGMATGSKRFPFDGGSETVTLAQMKTVTLEKNSESLESSKTHYVWSNYKEKTGYRPDTFIVRVWVDDTVIKVAAGTKPVEALAKDSWKLGALLTERSKGGCPSCEAAMPADKVRIGGPCPSCNKPFSLKFEQVQTEERTVIIRRR